MTDLNPAVATSLALLITYMIHSTLLLSAAGLYFFIHRGASPLLRNRLWKIAAVAGFITTPLALQYSNAVPFNLGAVEQPSVESTSTLPQGDPLPPSTSEPLLDEFVEVELNETPQPLDEPFDADDADFIATTEIDPPEEVIALEEASPRPRTIEADWTPVVSQTAVFPPEPTKQTFKASHFPTTGLIAALALIALLWGVGRLWGQSLWLSRYFADCRIVETGVAAEELARLLKQHAPRARVRLLASERYSEPAAFGLLRWSIVLPARAETELTRAELRSLLAHELAHLVRRDVWWLYLGRLLCTAFAYQPLNFLARRQWQRAAEFLCDEWAVSHTGDRFALAKCLTTVAQWKLDRNPLAGSLAATGERGTLTQRVEQLVKPAVTERRGSSWRTAAILFLMTAMIGGLILLGPTASLARPKRDLTPAPPDRALIEETPSEEFAAADVPVEELPTEEAAFEDLPSETSFETPTEFAEKVTPAAVQAELAGLRQELYELETLLARAGRLQKFRGWPTKLHSRIAEIELQLQHLNPRTEPEPFDPTAQWEPN